MNTRLSPAKIAFLRHWRPAAHGAAHEGDSILWFAHYTGGCARQIIHQLYPWQPHLQYETAGLCGRPEDGLDVVQCRSPPRFQKIVDP